MSLVPDSSAPRFSNPAFRPSRSPAERRRETPGVRSPNAPRTAERHAAFSPCLLSAALPCSVPPAPRFSLSAPHSRPISPGSFRLRALRGTGNIRPFIPASFHPASAPARASRLRPESNPRRSPRRNHADQRPETSAARRSALRKNIGSAPKAAFALPGRKARPFSDSCPSLPFPVCKNLRFRATLLWIDYKNLFDFPRNFGCPIEHIFR